MEKVTVRDLIAQLSELNPDAEMVTETNEGLKSKFMLGFDCSNKQTKQTSKTVIVYVSGKFCPVCDDLKKAVSEFLHNTLAAGNGGFVTNFGLVLFTKLVKLTAFDVKNRNPVKHIN